MKSPIRQDTILNSIMLFTAWLVLIAACIPEDVEAVTHPIRIAYQAE